MAKPEQSPIPEVPPLPYLAGVMDTHGNFCYQNGSTPNYKFRNVDRELLDILSSSFGGNVNEVRAKNHRGNRTFEWQISHNRLNDVLLKLRPWFFLRRHVVEEILAQEPRPVGRPRLHAVKGTHENSH